MNYIPLGRMTTDIRIRKFPAPNKGGQYWYRNNQITQKTHKLPGAKFEHKKKRENLTANVKLGRGSIPSSKPVIWNLKVERSSAHCDFSDRPCCFDDNLGIVPVLAAIVNSG